MADEIETTEPEVYESEEICFDEPYGCINDIY